MLHKVISATHADRQMFTLPGLTGTTVAMAEGMEADLQSRLLHISLDGLTYSYPFEQIERMIFGTVQATSDKPVASGASAPRSNKTRQG